MTEDHVNALSALFIMQPFSGKVAGYNEIPLASNIASCCGALLVRPNTSYLQYKDYRGSRIIGEFFTPDKDIRQDTADNVIVIPDETGNLLLEWTDK